jgi:hypothetical protein
MRSRHQLIRKDLQRWARGRLEAETPESAYNLLRTALAAYIVLAQGLFEEIWREAGADIGHISHGTRLSTGNEQQRQCL